MTRSVIEYSDDEKLDIDLDSKVLLAEIRRDIRKDGGEIYKNQIKTARETVEAFIRDRNIVNQLVVGKTQSGKSGCIIATICLMAKHYVISPKNMFLITGLSSLDWKNQTIYRFPTEMGNNIYHLGDLKRFAKDVYNKQNCLILIDEMQIASMSNNKISEIFKSIGLYDLKYLYANDIKIVQYTATPDGHIYDIRQWGDLSNILFMQPGDGYIGSYDLHMKNRLRQYKSLLELENVQEIYDLILNKYDTPLYHTIRIPSKENKRDEKIIANFKHIFKDNFIYVDRFLKSNKGDINNLLKKPPKTHTFIFIKDILRCAKTKEKKYLGVEYERCANKPYDTTIIQGSVGRLNGYDDNGISICFTNIESVIKYEKLWESKFTDKSVEWYSSTTTQIGKRNNTSTINTVRMWKGLKCIKEQGWGYVKSFVFSYNDYINKRNKSKEQHLELNSFVKWIKQEINYKKEWKRNPFDEKDKKEGFYKTSTTCNRKLIKLSVLKKEISSWDFKSGFDFKPVRIKKNLGGGWCKNQQLASRMFVCYEDNEPDKNNPLIYIRVLHGTYDVPKFALYTNNVDEELLEELAEMEEDLEYDTETKMVSYNGKQTSVWECEHPSLAGEEKFTWGICQREKTEEYKKWLANNGN